MTTLSRGERKLITSPAAQLRLPEGVTVGKIRTWRSRDGQGLETQLLVDGNRIGEVWDDGTGGGTYFRPDDRTARETFAVLTGLWTSGQDEPHYSIEEGLLNDLVEEAMTLKDLTRIHRGTAKRPGKIQAIKGTVRVEQRMGADYTYTAPEWTTLNVHPSALHTAADSLRRHGFTHTWDGTCWAPIPKETL